jgi:hypothetical protein
MPRLQDPVILAQYRSALANWRVTGYVDWKETARTWVRDRLGDYDPRQIARLMFEHVDSGGEIDQVVERRPEWDDRPFHYDLRIQVGGRLLYIETILIDDDPEDPVIRVVSIHEA